MLDRVGSHAEASARFLLDVTRVAHPGARVLDLGAGAGEQARLFAALGAEVVAIDRVARAVEGVEWRSASIEAWCDEPDAEPYDVVFARHVLQQLSRMFHAAAASGAPRSGARGRRGGHRDVLRAAGAAVGARPGTSTAVPSSVRTRTGGRPRRCPLRRTSSAGRTSATRVQPLSSTAPASSAAACRPHLSTSTIGL